MYSREDMKGMVFLSIGRFASQYGITLTSDEIKKWIEKNL